MKVFNELPPIELLEEYLNYDSFTGKLTWKKRPANRVKVGDMVGTPLGYGHLSFGFKGKQYLVHRVIWKLYYKQEPPLLIDHKNRVPDDNRIDNLRLTDQNHNMGNTKTYITSESKIKGVSLHKLSGLWRARITINYKDICIGYFKNKEDAIKARQNYAKNHFGEFARETKYEY